jgi:hypothetical protein
MTGMGISRHSYDPENRAALDAWGRRLEAIVSGKRAKGQVVELSAGPAAGRQALNPDLRHSLARRSDDSDLDSQPSQHVDQSVGAE